MKIFDPKALRCGDCVPHLAIHTNGSMATFIGGTLHLCSLVHYPDNSLLSSVDVDKHGLRLGVYTYDNVMMLAFKAGNTGWQDAPYSPHLDHDSELPKNTPFSSGSGLPAQHLLINSSNGQILQISSPFTLSAHFSNYLINAIHTLKQEPFNYNNYLATIAYIQQRYSSHELGVSIAQDYFKLPPK